MKSIISMILALALVLACLAGCDMNNELPTEPAPTEPTLPEDPTMEALETYIRFKEMQKKDYIGALKAYVHYEDPKRLEEVEEISERIFTYEILRIEKLSPKLWAVEFFFTSEVIPLGAYCQHYVGIIGGEYRIMIGLKNIPAELSEGLDLEPYPPHGPGVVG